MKTLRTLLFASILLSPALAYAASVVVTFVVPSSPSTSVTCSPVASGTANPTPANFAVCPITVLPTGWTGAVTVSDQRFGTSLVGGQLTLSTLVSLPTGSYPVTITTTP